MKCYFQILIISTVITVQWIGEVRCKPHKHIRKNVHVDRPKLPIKHVSLFLEKITPFGKLEFKHVINKRQAELPDILPKDVPIIEGTIDALTDTKELPVESHSDPVVIITSIVNPEDDGKSLLLSLPSDSELFVTPEYKTSAIIEKSVNEVLISKIESKQEVVESSIIEIDSPVEGLTPQPLEPLPPPEVPVEPTVVIDAIETPVQDGLPHPPPPPPPIVTIPIYRTLNFPYVSSIGNEGKKLLYTDITKIPLSFASYPTPVAVPVPEIILPQPQQPLPPPPPPPPLPPPPPPVIKEELPPIKEDNPNFFVKGSRLVLFVGSMMLQMLSKFVNGGFNINQIPIPILPEVQ